MNVVPWLNQAGEAWWRYVVHATWQGAVVAAAGLVMAWGGKRIPAPLRYAVLVVALLKLAAPPMWALPTGVFSRVEVKVEGEVGGRLAVDAARLSGPRREERSAGVEARGE